MANGPFLGPLDLRAVENSLGGPIRVRTAPAVALTLNRGKLAVATMAHTDESRCSNIFQQLVKEFQNGPPPR